MMRGKEFLHGHPPSLKLDGMTSPALWWRVGRVAAALAVMGLCCVQITAVILWIGAQRDSGGMITTVIRDCMEPVLKGRGLTSVVLKVRVVCIYLERRGWGGGGDVFEVFFIPELYFLFILAWKYCGTRVVRHLGPARSFGCFHELDLMSHFVGLLCLP